MKFEFGLDFGSSFTSIYQKNKGIILKEASLISLQKVNSTYNIVAIGNDCLDPKISDMENVVTFSPMDDGVIKSIDYSVLFLKHIFKKLFLHNEHKKNGWYIAIPCGLSSFQHKKFVKIFQTLKLKKYELIPSVFCSAIGAGLDFDGNNLVFLVDIGGSNTDVAVINSLSIIKGATLGLGGKTIDKAIVEYCKQTYNCYISEKQAEQVKMQIGSLNADKTSCVELTMFNYNCQQFVPLTLFAKEIRACILPILNEIADVIKATINECSQSIQDVLINDVIYLTGKSTQIKGIEEFFANSVGVRFQITEKFDNAVIIGLGQLLN